MKKLYLISSIFILFFTLTGCDQEVVDDLLSNMTDEQLKEYYENLYQDNTVESLTDLTDEQLKEYYENLYGEGGNDLTEYESDSSSSNTVYTFDAEDNTYIEYMSLNYNKAYMIQDSGKKVTYNQDQNGDLISLLTEKGETTFRNGIAISGATVCYTYTDIKLQGYDKFSGYFGAHSLARSSNSTSTSFSFRFVCDGVIVHETEIFNKDTEAKYIEIDLDGVEVFQVLVNTEGSGTGDYMAMGDPKFTKEKAVAYLDVFDLEFNLPEQVVPENILQYATAYDINYNDISDDITYETNYTKGAIGNFDLTYIIEQEVNGEVVERRDTVNLYVEDNDYSDTWTLEDYKTPYVNYMYHARQEYSPQMKKLFDLLVEAGINFNDEDWYRRYRSNIYTSQNYQSFNLANEGIYLSYNDVNKVLTGLWDCEPRIFMLLNLDLMGSYYCSTNGTTGLLTSAGFWAQNLTTEQYDECVTKILNNSERFLSYAKDDMTYAQKWKYVTDAYNSNVTYTDGNNMYNALGLLKAKCGGNSQGLVHLAQRLNMQSIYGNGGTYAGFHAWSYQKLPDDSTWYLTDKLWYTTLGTVEGYTSSHSVYTNRGYTFPPLSSKAYGSSNYTYPTIWATFNNSSYSIKQGETINLASNVKSYDGIFSDILITGATTIDIEIKDINGNVVSSNTSTLTAGYYTITYKLTYNNYFYDISRSYDISLAIE